MPEQENFKLFEGACARVFEIFSEGIGGIRKNDQERKNLPLPTGLLSINFPKAFSEGNADIDFCVLPSALFDRPS
ncbi:hypothetical protein [Desulfosalsimonas sp.]|uniref:hypothetical protein n=1 Tax=Desulfosalsimonas sp. TaxID=3073848 RepID=UPI003970521C